MASTFTRISPGTYDPTTGTYSGATTSTITGSLLKVRSDPVRFKALSLNLQKHITLLFSADSYTYHDLTTDFVLPGDTIVWNNLTLTVADVDATAPDGVVICARIAVSV